MDINNFEQFTLLVEQNTKRIQRIRNTTTAALGLKSIQLICILTLKYFKDGLAAVDLSEQTGYDKALISRTLKELNKEGYVCRNETDLHKQRGYRWILTERGWETAIKLKNIMVHMQEIIEQNISVEDIEAFYRIIPILAKNIQELMEHELER